MLEEAVDVIRALCGGRAVQPLRHYYTVENARFYTMPAAPPPIIVSAFGPKSVELAARIGDGMVSTAPDARPARCSSTPRGGRGKPKLAQVKVCWAPKRT